MSNVYSRKKKGKKYDYFLNGQKVSDQKLIERFNSLVIPPAWKNVEIASSPTAKIQATGKDKAGRTQAIYSTQFRAQQEEAKFRRIMDFAEHLPDMRSRISSDLAKRSLTKDKVLACIVKLMDEAYFRVGNENYAKDHKTYGITTLRKRHTTIHTSSIVFDFIGKSGKRHIKTINNKQLARIMKQLDELPGSEAFQYLDEDNNTHTITSSDVNLYIKTTMGDEFTAKDFRTWGGTLVATSELALSKSTKKMKDKEKNIRLCVKEVSKKLGNTPAIARSSYIDPRIIETYLHNDVLSSFESAIKKIKPEKYMKPEERYTLNLLKNYR